MAAWTLEVDDFRIRGEGLSIDFSDYVMRSHTLSKTSRCAAQEPLSVGDLVVHGPFARASACYLQLRGFCQAS